RTATASRDGPRDRRSPNGDGYPWKAGTLPVGGEFPIVLPRRLNESTTAVMQPDATGIPRQVSLRDAGPHWRSIDRLARGTDCPRWHRTPVRPRSASDTA